MIGTEEALSATCARCHHPIGAHSKQCPDCGVTFGPAVNIETRTRVQIKDAIANEDIAQIVRVVLEAHADGLIEVVR